MTRRSFISDLLKCGIATTFLPGAGRIWKPTYPEVGIRFITPTPVRLDLDAMMQNLYEIMRARQRLALDSPFMEFHIPSEPIPIPQNHKTVNVEITGIYQQMREA